MNEHCFLLQNLAIYFYTETCAQMFVRAFIGNNPKLKILNCLTMDEWLNGVRNP